VALDAALGVLVGLSLDWLAAETVQISQLTADVVDMV